jgi:hypothetical protein
LYFSIKSFFYLYMNGIVSASDLSAIDFQGCLLDLLSLLPLRGAARDLCSGSGLTVQPDKPTQRLGTLSCLQLGFSFSSTSALL